MNSVWFVDCEIDGGLGTAHFNEVLPWPRLTKSAKKTTNDAFVAGSVVPLLNFGMVVALFWPVPQHQFDIVKIFGDVFGEECRGGILTATKG
jgi:hypothetical protein